MGLLNDFFEPLKEIKDITSDFRNEVVSSATDIAKELVQVKEEGAELISETTELPLQDEQPASDTVDKQ